MMPRGPYFTTSELRTAVKLHATGTKISAIAAALGRSKNGVRYQLRQAGAPLRRHGLSGRKRKPVDMPNVLQMRAAGLTIRQTAVRLGVAYSLLQRRLAERA